MTKLAREDRVPAITPEEFYNRIAEADTRPVPSCMRENRPYEGGSYEVPVHRFLSKDYHDQEVEKLWKRVWQVACREEEIPAVGDAYLYEVATLQYIVVRSAPDKIRAFSNSCLHRGRQIIDCSKRTSELRCPFHGFTWDLEGRISAIPNAWEFAYVEDPNHWKLPECKVGTWGGFVFINPDQEAESLADYLGDIGRHFERYPLEDRYIAGHARKVVSCNWKVAQEAFLEAYHVYATHPQLVPQGSHSDMKYDCYENYSRTVSVNYIPNAATAWDPTIQEILDSAMDRRQDEERTVIAEEGVPARQQMARIARAGLERVTGESADHFSDSELVDINFFSIFPNIHAWSMFSRIAYLFRPYKDNPDKAWMDIFQLMPFDKKKGRPPAAAPHFLTDNEDWTAAPEINVYLGRISNQDTVNMKPIQDGLKASATGFVQYSDYQESRIRHFHDLLEKWVGP